MNKCEVRGCRNKRSCFHYCHKHHLLICCTNREDRIEHAARKVVNVGKGRDGREKIIMIDAAIKELEKVLDS